MKRSWKYIAVAGLFLVAGAGVARASITDRFESGRLRIKGWRTEAWPTAQGIRIVQTPMVMTTTPSGRVSYSSAFQAPAGAAAAANPASTPIVISEPVFQSRSTGSGVPASIPHSFKGTYRNSR